MPIDASGVPVLMKRGTLGSHTRKQAVPHRKWLSHRSLPSPIVLPLSITVSWSSRSANCAELGSWFPNSIPGRMGGDAQVWRRLLRRYADMLISASKLPMTKHGHRLAFLIVEAEPVQRLSTRKLLIAFANHNVLTAYSCDEGIQMFKRFPRVDAVVVDSELHGNEGLARWVKEQNPRIRVVCLSPREAAEAFWADQTINSHDPAALLKLLEEMGGRTDI